ncbi:MerR family transcriptional regulator [Umezawaea sp.]|uniref:helix-turn-helix domain-containing protein n=1 Tax=Umezawaea sp. TaxID=1955258 RepID=UPI002ED26DD2
MSEALLKIGELAARSGVSIRTIDYYTGLGLLAPAKRTASNYRLYSPADADRIGVIQRLETQGVSLEEISRALGSQPADVADLLTRITADLDVLQAAISAADPETHGLLAAIAGRVHSLVTIALQIPPDLPLT